MPSKLILLGVALAASPMIAQAQTAPGQSMPGQSMPGQSMPGQSMPGQSMPGQTLPGQPAPGQTPPGPQTPGSQPTPPVSPTTPGQGTANTAGTTALSNDGSMTTATDGRSAPTPATNSADAVSQVIDSQWSTYDKNGNGSLSKSEFGQWMATLRADDATGKGSAGSMKKWTDAAFVQADTDKSKSVSREELAAFLAGGQNGGRS